MIYNNAFYNYSNGILNMNGYYWYYIYFYISDQFWIQIRIMSTIIDEIQLYIDIINIQFDGYNIEFWISRLGYK
jgi:hypothetical protein